MPSSSPKYYKVYRVQFPLSLADPDMPSPRYHNIIWVETDPGKSGVKHHVTGDIVAGMTYQGVPYHHPSNSNTKPHAIECIGYTEKSTEEWKTFLKTVPTPPAQKAFNIKTMKTEPFKTKTPLTFYQPGEARRPLWKCTEWTNNKAIPALKNAGYVKAGSPPASRPSSSGSTKSTKK